MEQKTITVQILTGKGPAKTYTVPQQTKVSDLIATAVSDFGLPPGDSYTLTRQSNEEELSPERPLVSYHLADNEILVLTDVTGGA
jgi:hypothetical protein